VSRRSLVALVAAISAALVLAGVAVALLSGDDDREPPPELSPAALETCERLGDDAARACLARRFARLVSGRDDPLPAVQAIADQSWRSGGFLLENCHVVMHTVGRRFAREADVSPATLMEYLPQSNDPGCSAGFAHGLVTGAAPKLDVSEPARAVSACADAGTRYQRYSCVHGFGHAFMRVYGEQLEPALELCTALGRETAADCAQGAYHDYWFAVKGADDAKQPADPETNPRLLCGAQPAAYVRPCWYRAFVEVRPAELQLESPRDLADLCAGLEGVQRAGCITGAAVIGPADPFAQLAICAGLPSAADAASCVRGTKVQNLLDAPTAEYVRLIGECERFAAQPRAFCFRWMGKVLAVVTDGRFRTAGCSKLREPEARRACVAGARTMEEPLETFS
jgi:hypothetical protein